MIDVEKSKEKNELKLNMNNQQIHQSTLIRHVCDLNIQIVF